MTTSSRATGPDGFGIENLPYGVVRMGTDQTARVVVRLGDAAIDLGAADIGARAGVDAGVFARPSLNDFLALGPGAWSAVRSSVHELVASGGDALAHATLPLEAVDVMLPIEIGDYVDFYSSIHHTTNLGRILRPDAEPLLSNWKQLPVGYHGRAGTVVVSGTPVARPAGLVDEATGPVFTLTRALDIELEVGFVVGAAGTRIAPDDADQHIFGVVLLNDWSARDIQAFEYQPLGPHLAKSFATTISPWVVTMEAIAPFLVRAPVQDPQPVEYLRATRPWALDLELRVALNGTEICATNFRDMYWTFAQQLAHMTVNGATTRPGDLYGSGTVSGPDAGERGSLIEITWRGRDPLMLDDGSERTYLEDGDVVEITGWCGGDERPRVGLGWCAGTIVARED